MPWEEPAFKVFISHVSQHKEVAQQLHYALKRCGMDGFVAHTSIEPTADWQREIETRLSSMDAMIALLTERFSESLWCNQEVGWAAGSNRLLIPLMAGEHPRGFFGRSQGMSIGDGNFVRLTKEIFEIFASNPMTADRMALVTSVRFREVDSWEEIKVDLVPQLKMITRSNPDVTQNIVAAFQENGYVRSSFYVGNLRRELRAAGFEIPDRVE